MTDSAEVDRDIVMVGNVLGGCVAVVLGGLLSKDKTKS